MLTAADDTGVKVRFLTRRRADDQKIRGAVPGRRCASEFCGECLRSWLSCVDCSAASFPFRFELAEGLKRADELRSQPCGSCSSLPDDGSA